MSAPERPSGPASSASSGPRLHSVLTDLGDEPVADDNGHTILRNCPFAAIQAIAAHVVCALNVPFCKASSRGCDDDPRGSFPTSNGRCCVVISNATLDTETDSAVRGSAHDRGFDGLVDRSCRGANYAQRERAEVFGSVDGQYVSIAAAG